MGRKGNGVGEGNGRVERPMTRDGTLLDRGQKGEVVMCIGNVYDEKQEHDGMKRDEHNQGEFWLELAIRGLDVSPGIILRH